jgi:hypothetical protein
MSIQPSIHPSAHTEKSRRDEPILIVFDIGQFYEKLLSDLILNLNPSTSKGTVLMPKTSTT